MFGELSVARRAASGCLEAGQRQWFSYAIAQCATSNDEAITRPVAD
jgi:hypothetical protein